MPPVPAEPGVLLPPRRFQFGIKHLLLGVAIVAAILGIWTGYLRKIVDVRQAEASDRVYDRYFGFASEDMRPRNILVVTGSFTKSTWLSGRLYHVKSGSATEINAFTVGRTPNAVGDWIWENMRITLALGDKDTPAGRMTNLGSAGQTRGVGSGGETPHSVKAAISRAIPGKITPGREYVVYIEGDREPAVNRNATLDTFARDNNGDYLVVTLQLQ